MHDAWQAMLKNSEVFHVVGAACFLDPEVDITGVDHRDRHTHPAIVEDSPGG